MEIELAGKETAVLFDPLRVWREMGRDRHFAENLGRAILGLPDFVIETPFALLENLFWNIPRSLLKVKAHQKPVTYGYVDLQNELSAENLFNSVRGESKDEGQWIKIRQPWVDQYSDKFSPYRLDVNLTPLLLPEFSSYRIMMFELLFRFDTPIQTTDVYPQTCWEKEGLHVGDHVALDVIGKYKPLSKVAVKRVNVGPAGVDVRSDIGVEQEMTAQRNYFYTIEYAPEVPTIEGRALSNGFGWRFTGTYERFIEW